MSSINPLRYWPDAITPIVNGTAPANYADFRARAHMLLAFKHEDSIKECYEAYCANSQLVDISDRVDVLSKTKFLHEISICTETFDADETTYMEVCSFPGAMKATPGGLELIQNQKASQWLSTYHLGITSPKTIEYNVRAYRGLTRDQMVELSEQRGLASGWFQFYGLSKEQMKERAEKLGFKKEEFNFEPIDKTTVQTLMDVLKMDSQGTSHQDFFPKSLMSIYYEKYIALATTFRELDQKGVAIGKDGVPYSREKAYWESLQSNLTTFIEKAK